MWFAHACRPNAVIIQWTMLTAKIHKIIIKEFEKKDRLGGETCFIEG